MTDDARIVELELRYSHLQKAVDDLSDVVMRQDKQLDQLNQLLAQISGRTESLEHLLDEPRDPQDEKPPHY